MNPGRILSAFTESKVDCIVIGVMNFFLRHLPVTTFDVDLWVKDEAVNLERVNAALTDLGAECERADGTWGPVASDASWLRRRAVHCLTSPAGALDIFRFVQGLASYDECRERSTLTKTAEGTAYRSLSDADMLACQLAARGIAADGSGCPSAKGSRLVNLPQDFEALHARRDRQAGPMTWKQIEEFLTWAEQQLPPELQRNRPRRHPANDRPIPSP